MKKLVIGLAGLLVAGLSGVITYFAIPKDKPIDLKVDVSDIVAEVGECADITWDVNLEESLITFEISDETKASYKQVSGKDCICGLAIGETTLKINAKYDGVKASDSAKITVIAKQNDETPPAEEDNEEPTDGEEEAPTEEPNEPEETPSGFEDDDEEDESPSETTNIFKKLLYCKLEDNKIVINNGATFALVQISLGDVGIETIDFEYDTSKMIVEMNADLCNNSYNIFVNTAGEYALTIFINGAKYEFMVVKS